MINPAGELDFKYMEKPKSVHLSREFYPHWQGWEYNGLEQTRESLNITTRNMGLDAFL
jgi:hypothetical protein